MADTKISALTAAGAAAGANELAINEAGTSKKLTVTQLETFILTSPVIAAGTASANTWPKLTSGTLLTTPEAGALELDANCLYATTDAGNRGVVPIVHLIRCNATNTLTSAGTEQPIFDVTGNGAITLEIGTYLFNSLIYLTAMSATSGNAAVDWLGAGTAVCGDWLYQNVGNDIAIAAAGAMSGSIVASQQSPASAVTAATATVMHLSSSGTFTVTTGGTMIPGITLVTAAAAVVAIGSYFLCYRIGDAAVVSVGQWS